MLARVFYLPELAMFAIALVTISSYGPDHWFTSFLAGMRLHLAGGLLLMTLFCLLIYRNPFHIAGALLATAVLAHSYIILQSKAIELTPDESINQPALKVVEFNILWDNKRGKEVVDWIIQSNADIAFILEAFPLHEHMEQIEKAYPYRIGCDTHKYRCDLMLLSKFPLNNIRRETFSNHCFERLFIADIEWEDQTVHLAAIHLNKPFEGTAHHRELYRARRLLNKRKGPLIVAGDFNSSILADTVQNFMTKLDLNTVPFEPNTWPVSGTALGLPIDHIMTRLPLAMRNHSRLPDAMGSNHYGLQTEVVLLDDSAKKQ